MPEQIPLNQENEMEMKQLFFGACAVSMLAASTLMVQSAFNHRANATSGLSENEYSVLDRVKDLEWQQKQDVREFVLIDETMWDMNAKFEIKLMDLRAQLNSMNIPVTPLVGDDIGITYKAKAAGFRENRGVVLGPGGTGWLRDENNTGTNPSNIRNYRSGITLGPGGSGWLRDDPTAKPNPAGKRKKEVTVGPGGNGW